MTQAVTVNGDSGKTTQTQTFDVNVDGTARIEFETEIKGLTLDELDKLPATHLWPPSLLGLGRYL